MKNPNLRGAISAMALLFAGQLATAATFTVINTNDSGAGSFRQALLSANSTAGANTILFNIPGSGIHTIAPIGVLPDITNSITINGYSQPGATPNTLTNSDNAVLLIRLDGVNLTSGFPIGLKLNGANSSTVRGLIIARFYTAIQIYSSSACTIAGNWLGVDFDDVSRGGTGTGVDVTCPVFGRAAGNLIGGTTPADRNLIGGFHTGISFTPAPADHNVVQGNFIGTDSSGSLGRGNLFNGVSIQTATNILIGGASPGARNVISANGTGIGMNGTSGEIIQGNYIGTDATGRTDLGNKGDGIDLQSTYSVTVGGTNAGNVIGNNTGYGISLLGCSTNWILGNWVGTDPTGTFAMGNGKDGLYLQGSSATMIGGADVGAGNTIEFNYAAGITIFTGGSNTISANSIYDNSGAGISLTSGANSSATPPTLTGAVSAYASTQIQGTLASQPNLAYRVEFFANPPWDASSVAEGRYYLGATTTTTDAGGNGAFSVLLPVASSSDAMVTATATDPAGNTSQFSVGIPVTVGPTGVSLSIARATGSVKVCWPATAAGYQLETTSSLSAPIQWHSLGAGVLDNVTNLCVVVTNGPSAPSAQFYRLRR
jgi:hypothetical protein